MSTFVRLVVVLGLLTLADPVCPIDGGIARQTGRSQCGTAGCVFEWACWSYGHRFWVKFGS